MTQKVFSGFMLCMLGHKDGEGGQSRNKGHGFGCLATTNYSLGDHMKKYLYGTTILAAVGLATSPVSAAEPIHLELGGFYSQWFGFVDDGVAGVSNELSIQNVEVYFKIRGELDNGLKIGGRIELEGGLGISGRVLDPGGEPLPGVMIMVEPKPGTPGPGGHAQTDSAGRFRVTGLEPGLFQLDAFPLDAATKGRPPMLPAVLDASSGSLPLEIQLQAANAITGRVVDDQGRAVFHATVRALDPKGKIAALDLTQADGSFTLLLEGSQEVDLIATPPPEDGMFYDYARVDPALGVRRKTVAPGTSGLVLTLPVR